jgi:S-ribosylhomocysteine lyase
MERIASFTVDHTRLLPGLYLSRRDGEITTFDLRFKRPNTGDLLSNSEMHSVEHLIATLLRNSPEKEAVVYFGPMGCQTGFYFLFNSRLLSDGEAVALVQRVFAQAAAFDGPMPGKSQRECGNFRNLDTETGRRACAWYAGLIRDWSAEKLAYEPPLNAM